MHKQRQIDADGGECHVHESAGNDLEQHSPGDPSAMMGKCPISAQRHYRALVMWPVRLRICGFHFIEF